MTRPGNSLSGLRDAASGPLEAYLRMMAAAASDVTGAVTGHENGDPFELRDPEYIEHSLPAWRLASNLYFRAFHDHFGSGRVFHQLAHVAQALKRDAALLVYPGGDHETFRPSWESDQVDFAQRAGFIKLALEHDVPIVPVVAIGGQETGLFLGQGGRLARSLKLNRLLRLKVFPAVIGPPFGATILDLPLRFPLPAKISIRVLKPIKLRERLGQDPSVEDGYRLVTSTMQRTLTRLSNERDLPVVG